MSETEKEEIRATIAEAVAAAVHAELGEYKIPKEQHYLDHNWLKEWREWQGQVRNSVIKSVVTLVLGAVAALLFYGFIFFSRGGNK
ncbi:MAG: hypothetical protein HY890_05675 [Deltaproteobacteria bacterium]|nr:hypothetical protein [Deltaproteobacteria bacterium]